jgi:hypothetical protein
MSLDELFSPSILPLNCFCVKVEYNISTKVNHLITVLAAGREANKDCSTHAVLASKESLGECESVLQIISSMVYLHLQMVSMVPQY